MIIKLPGNYSLRHVDKDTWWLQFRGMDWLRITSSVPCADNGSIEGDIKDFAEAMNADPARK